MTLQKNDETRTLSRLAATMRAVCALVVIAAGLPLLSLGAAAQEP